MNTSHDPVKPCTTLGHVYSSVMLVVCPHDGAHWLHTRAWVDNDFDEPQILSEESHEFGPFDDRDDIAAVAQLMVQRAVIACTDAASL